MIDGAHAGMLLAGLAGSDGALMPNRATPGAAGGPGRYRAGDRRCSPRRAAYGPRRRSRRSFPIPYVGAMSPIVSELVARNGSHDAKDRLRWSPALGSNATAIGTSAP